MTNQAAVIHIVDDDESARTATSRLLRAAGYEARGYASVGEFLLASPEELEVPECAILDVQLPGPSGLDLQDSLAKRGSILPVIFVSGHGDIPISVRAMKAGAVDFLTKPVQKETLLSVIRLALARHDLAKAVRQRAAKLREYFSTLTPRERQVFDEVIAGRLNKQIADNLGTAERTVKAHRAQVMEKLHAESLADLVHLSHLLRDDGGSAAPGMQS